MSDNPSPTLIIFAGANGSGKTTAAEYLLKRIGLKEFVNADEIARGLSPFNPASQAVSAGKLVLKRTDRLIGQGKSFAIETTLSGHHIRKIIAKAKAAGYVVELYYLFCRDVNVNLARITNRVKQGGHHVPADDVRRRYWRSLVNFHTVYKDICDIVYLYDTTGESLVFMARKIAGQPFEGYHEAVTKFQEKVNEAIRDHR